MWSSLINRHLSITKNLVRPTLSSLDMYDRSGEINKLAGLPYVNKRPKKPLMGVSSPVGLGACRTNILSSWACRACWTNPLCRPLTD